MGTCVVYCCCGDELQPLTQTDEVVSNSEEDGVSVGPTPTPIVLIQEEGNRAGCSWPLGLRGLSRCAINQHPAAWLS